MREVFTSAEAEARGLTRAALRWGERTGKWRRIGRGVYAVGPDQPTQVDVAVARVLRGGQAARGRLAGVLHGLDSVALTSLDECRRPCPPSRIVTVHGIACADGLQTLLDLATTLEDDTWEQVAESAFRRKLCTEDALLEAVAGMSRPGSARIRRVLARRGPGAPATESLLETLMVQLSRKVDGLAPPVRQLEVHDDDGSFVARVDLCWPDLGLFVELDGQHHRDQPVYDSRRETAVVAATGWLCGRFTWTEVVRVPRSTVRRLDALVEQARRRPVPAGRA